MVPEAGGRSPVSSCVLSSKRVDFLAMYVKIIYSREAQNFKSTAEAIRKDAMK